MKTAAKLVYIIIGMRTTKKNANQMIKKEAIHDCLSIQILKKKLFSQVQFLDDLPVPFNVF